MNKVVIEVSIDTINSNNAELLLLEAKDYLEANGKEWKHTP